MSNQNPDTTVSPTTISNEQQIKRLKQIHDVTVRMAHVAELDALLKEVVTIIQELVEYKRVLLLILDEDDVGLKFGYISDSLNDEELDERLQSAYVSTYNIIEDPILGQWIQNTPVEYIEGKKAPESPVTHLLEIPQFKSYFSIPLMVNNRISAVIIIECSKENPVTAEDKDLLMMFAQSASVILQNTRLHSQTVKKLASSMHEMSILQQIDRELNETIALNTVFNMTLDWALRFSNASYATIAFYDEEHETLRTVLNYGYEMSDEELETLRGEHDNTIAHRVAHSGRVEVIPDVMMDRDFTWAAQGIRSQMSIPVMREDRVTAVVTLESRKVNAFTDEHVSFVQQLANRAGVAMDNARLYDETVREREKLSYIVGSIGDVVAVVDLDGSIVLISRSATNALGLETSKSYAGQRFVDVVGFQPLVDMYDRCTRRGEEIDEELTLPNGRIYAVKANQLQGVGYIIVMQDITPFKEMDRLKSELIATVSHDLKQPLGVMRGYLDLLQMTNTFEEKSQGFVDMIERAITSMRQLIDDLLDLARIESGVELELEPVSLTAVISECVDANIGNANTKEQKISLEQPPQNIFVTGERFRLQQIFNNLIGNAVKYTQPEGSIKVELEDRGATVRVSIQDNGLGISEEDQQHIFERFYRVRRSETASIDGTGLGLAIVKKLVEAHHGKIRVESEVGEGSTFYITLPRYQL